LPSRISIQKLQENKLEDSELKTAKALFELSDINTKEIVEADDGYSGDTDPPFRAY
jgi:hypothetical protein